MDRSRRRSVNSSAVGVALGRQGHDGELRYGEIKPEIYIQVQEGRVVILNVS